MSKYIEPKFAKDLSERRIKRIRSKVLELEKTMQCNCDLDNWEPEKLTGHSWVCRIREAALAEGGSDAE